jgi:hypothetical protein
MDLDDGGGKVERGWLGWAVNIHVSSGSRDFAARARAPLCVDEEPCAHPNVPADCAHTRVLQRAMLVLCIVAHAAYSLIVLFILFGLVERLGFCAVSLCRWMRAGPCSSEPDPAKPLPVPAPSVCVQLPMYNERAVATRSIAAACSLRWPRDSFEVQVLDDSTEPDVRAMVDAAAASWRARGVRCEVIRRAGRGGYKAGALELGRKQTSAEFLALFDADFVPNEDFLLRTVPSFFGANGEALEDLALVQGQWAHLNALDSLLTLSQSLSLDDHHSAQMVWRSAMIGCAAPAHLLRSGPRPVPQVSPETRKANGRFLPSPPIPPRGYLWCGDTR